MCAVSVCVVSLCVGNWGGHRGTACTCTRTLRRCTAHDDTRRAHADTHTHTHSHPQPAQSQRHMAQRNRLGAPALHPLWFGKAHPCGTGSVVGRAGRPKCPAADRQNIPQWRLRLRLAASPASVSASPRLRRAIVVFRRARLCAARPRAPGRLHAARVPFTTPGNCYNSRRVTTRRIGYKLLLWGPLGRCR